MQSWTTLFYDNVVTSRGSTSVTLITNFDATARYTLRMDMDDEDYQL